MSVESVLLSEGGGILIKKILHFYSTVVVKNTVEAELTETVESLEHYQKYQAAYFKYDNFSYYEDVLTRQRLEDSLIPESLILIALYDVKEFNKYIGKNIRVTELLNSLRDFTINNYIDKNRYYATRSGNPVVGEQIINVNNLDLNDGSTLELHNINPIKNPITYEFYLLMGEIDNIIADQPELEYLQYIAKPINSMAAREAKQFEILSFRADILTGSELDYFLDAYNDTVEYVLDKYYNDGYTETYAEYSNSLFQMIVFGSMSKFIISYLKKYSLADYTDEDVIKIIESNNLANLKDINIDILRKVVANLSFLQKEAGKEKVLRALLDMVATDNSTVRRYVLAKKYNIDERGNILLDPNKSYSENVGLEFIDSEITNGTTRGLGDGSNVIDYDTFVQDDDSFGGVYNVENIADKRKIKSELKEQLIHMDFDISRTKYITISNIIYTHDPYLKSVDMFGLGIQLDGPESFIFMDDIQIESVSATLFDLFIFISWIGSNILYKGDPDKIDKIQTSVTKVYSTRLNTKSSFIAVNEISQKVFRSISGSNVNVGNVLSGYDLKQFVVTFNINTGTTLLDINQQYALIKDTLDRVSSRLEQSVSEDESNAWKLIDLYNHGIIDYHYALKGEATYSGYLTRFAPDLYDAYNYTVNKEYSSDIVRNSELRRLMDKLSGIYSTEIERKSFGVMDVSIENEKTTMSNMQDLTTLLEVFVSQYTELRKIEIETDLQDYPFNCLKLREAVADISILDVQEFFTLEHHYDITQIDNATDGLAIDGTIVYDQFILNVLEELQMDIETKGDVLKESNMLKLAFEAFMNVLDPNKPADVDKLNTAVGLTDFGEWD